MTYSKQQWKDEIPDLTKPIKDASGKQKTDLQTGRPLYELVQEGTRITSARLNHIEDGVEGAHTQMAELSEDLETHTSDVVRHLTAAERAAWNDKETPAAAQQKADTSLAAAKSYADTQLLTKADKSTTYSKEETNQRIQDLVGAAPDALDTLKEIGDALNNDPNFAATMTTQLSSKVDKISGKQLTTEDYTTAEKAKLAGITVGAGGAGSATDTVIGNRTINDSTAPIGETGTLTTLLSWLANMIKAITGKSSWRTAPATTLEAAKAHADDATRHIITTERNTWNAKETTAGAQAKADAAKDAAITAAAADATAKANAARDAAKAASISKGEKGAAGGVADLDASGKVPRERTYSSLGGKGGATNLNTAFVAGIWIISPDATGSPEPSGYGLLENIVSEGDVHDGSTNWIFQIVRMTGGAVYSRIKINQGVWSAWNLEGGVGVFKTKGIVGTDYNEYIHPGTYQIYGNIPANAPPLTAPWGILNVYMGSNGYIVQEATQTTSPLKFYRARTETEWGPWNKVITDSDTTYFAKTGKYVTFGGAMTGVTTAEFITMLTNMGAHSPEGGYWVGRGDWSYGTNVHITDSGFGNIHLAGAVVEVIGSLNGDAFTIRITTPTTSGIDPTTRNSEFIYVNNGPQYEPGWRRSWNSSNMPKYTADSNANTLVVRNADGNFAVGNAIYFGDNDGIVYDDSSNAMYARLDGNNYGLYHQGNDSNLMVTRDLPSTNLDDAVIPGTYFLGANNIYINGSGLDYGLMKVYRNPVGYVVQEVTGVGMVGQRYRTRAETGWWNAWMMVPVADASSGKYGNIGNKRWNITDVQVGPSGDATRTIAEWTPTVKANYSVKVYMKVQQACSVIVQIESAEGVDMLLPYQYIPADTYRFPISFFVAAPGIPIKVVVGASASNAVYVSAAIEEE
ncbi:pyocin knob domain-containing protein [Paenibacillus sp. FSL L8-0436]|uniref:pyocin knob domain-containing protein n=1 Tax=Paenibacillus sp. FSL L8-0436 TaxID=2954686 RepID=UPI003158A1F5